MHRIAFLLLLIACNQSAAERLIIKHGRIIDGNGRVLQNHDLAIRDERIVDVAAAIAAGADDTVLDARANIDVVIQNGQIVVDNR